MPITIDKSLAEKLYWLDGDGQAQSRVLEKPTWIGMGMKYSPDQPRVPAGSPEGGRWVSRTVVGTGPYTAGVGGMALADAHMATIVEIVHRTWVTKGQEHGFVIGRDGVETQVVQGDDRSIRLRGVRPGDQGNVHTHPAHTDYVGPSARDIASHLYEARLSNNENYTSIVVSLARGHGYRKMITTIKGMGKGDVANVESKIYFYVRARVARRTRPGERVVVGSQEAREAVREYCEEVLGLEMEVRYDSW